MARTSTKAKKPKEEVLKSKVQSNTSDNVESKGPEDINDSTDKENGDSNYEVEKIVHTRFYRKKRQYLVRWKGYQEESDTWENESVVQSCTEALDAFWKENPELKTETEKKEDNTEKQDSHVPETSNLQMSEGNKRNVQLSSDSESEKSTNENQSKKQKLVTESELSSDKSEKSYEVEKVMEVRVKKDGRREFLIHWKGYRPSEDTWEPEAHLECFELIEAFMEATEKAKQENTVSENSNVKTSEKKKSKMELSDSESEQTKNKSQTKKQTVFPKRKLSSDTKSDKTNIEKDKKKKDTSNVKQKAKRSKNPQKEGENKSDEDSDSNEKSYEVEKVTEVRVKKDGNREFLIHWKGYLPSEDTWEPEAHLDCYELIEAFMEASGKAKLARLKQGKKQNRNKLIITVIYK